MAEVGVTDSAEVISSGDIEPEVASAQLSEVSCAGLLTGYLTTEQFQALKADHILDSVANIPALINN